MNKNFWKLGLFIPLFFLAFVFTWGRGRASSQPEQIPGTPDPSEMVLPFESPPEATNIFTQTTQITDTLEITNVALITITDSYTIYLPIIIQPPPPPTLVLYCEYYQNPISIPDNNTSGITVNLNTGDAGKIYDMNVRLEITHTWIGDLVVNVD